MAKKIVALMGSYRKGGIIDQTVDAMLEEIKFQGAEAVKVCLSDWDIQFCTNCRTCTEDDPGKDWGTCVHKDDMNELVPLIESADGIILASPVNFGNVTAVMKKFIERLIVYAYWPWEQKIPKLRKRGNTRGKKAVLVTSSACPGFIARFLMPGPLKTMKSAANIFGAKVIGSLYFGGACTEKGQKLNDRQLIQTKVAAERLLGNL